jgi:hypothetical protein
MEKAVTDGPVHAQQIVLAYHEQTKLQCHPRRAEQERLLLLTKGHSPPSGMGFSFHSQRLKTPPFWSRLPEMQLR